MPEQVSASVLLKQRREELDVTQAFIAWAAGVSRNTVGNLERGEGNPEQRVIRSVALAMAVNWAKIYDEEIAEQKKYVLAAPAVRRVYGIVGSLQEGVPKEGRRVMDAFTAFIDDEVEQELLEANPFEVSHTRSTSQHLIRFIRLIEPHLTLADPRDSALIEALMERGWKPEESSGLGVPSPRVVRRRAQGRPPVWRSYEEPASATGAFAEDTLRREPETKAVLAQYLKGAQAFARLPARLQGALLNGHVADYGTFERNVRDTTIPLIALVIRPDDVGDVTAVEMAQAVSYWTSTIALASSLMAAGTKQGMDLGEIVDRVQVVLHGTGEDTA